MVVEIFEWDNKDQLDAIQRNIVDFITLIQMQYQRRMK